MDNGSVQAMVGSVLCHLIDEQFGDARNLLELVQQVRASASSSASASATACVVLVRIELIPTSSLVRSCTGAE